jgi:hypothetical protein
MATEHIETNHRLGEIAEANQTGNGVMFSETELPFMYQTSIEGIRNVLKECWNTYTIESHKGITWFHKLAALKLT